MKTFFALLLVACLALSLVDSYYLNGYGGYGYPYSYGYAGLSSYGNYGSYGYYPSSYGYGYYGKREAGFGPSPQ